MGFRPVPCRRRLHRHVGANTCNGRSEPAGGYGLAWFEVVVPDNAALAAVRERLAAADVAVGERGDGIEFGVRTD
ncbi:hypothetical protein [Halobellus ruber]|uniref:Uncharacterized protein n=1 Tax=Halobellus ruber TaxID=2761102 RepID=A0A7J9SID5_9EURY|nr:hypothetical protein [Halobellus ruber]